MRDWLRLCMHVVSLSPLSISLHACASRSMSCFCMQAALPALGRCEAHGKERWDYCRHACGGKGWRARLERAAKKCQCAEHCRENEIFLDADKKRTGGGTTRITSAVRWFLEEDDGEAESAKSEMMVALSVLL